MFHIVVDNRGNIKYQMNTPKYLNAKFNTIMFMKQIVGG